jgi:hypothetical protein
MLHRAMRSVSHRHTAMAIEIARNGGAFVRCHRLFRLLGPCYGPLKLIASYNIAVYYVIN